MKSFKHQSKRVAADNAIRSSGVAQKPTQPSQLTTNNEQARVNFRITQTYQILPQIKLGHGITGQVNLCVHRPTSQLCAIKAISRDRVRRKYRIRREIDLLREAEHPNIIRFLDAYENEKEAHIITELCCGGELFDKIVEKANVQLSQNSAMTNQGCGSLRHQAVPASPACFCEKDATQIIRCLLSAVSYLHSRDIIHRDIKPDNVMFTEKNNEESPIKLIDFGFAIRHTRNCRPLTGAAGTLSYSAPEVLKGSYNRSCDLWSVGVLTYVMLTGRQPFDAPTCVAISDKIKRGQYDMNCPGLCDGSECAKDFIRRLMDVDSQRRWTADMALEHDWLK